jgi:hypothetical protein
MRNFGTTKKHYPKSQHSKVYKWATYEVKKSCWKGVHAEFSKFGMLLLDFVDNGQKGIRH